MIGINAYAYTEHKMRINEETDDEFFEFYASGLRKFRNLAIIGMVVGSLQLLLLSAWIPLLTTKREIPVSRNFGMYFVLEFKFN